MYMSGEAEAESVPFRTVRALVKFASGPGNVAVQEVPAPELSPGKVLIDVHAVAICGTDRSAIAGGHDMKVPRTLGHEVAGTIAAIASDVTAHLAVGDRVTVETDAYRCGNCEYCLKGEYNRCPYRLGIGTTVDGGLAGEVVVVIGPGAIGLLCAQVARAVGATVVLVGRSRHADRLELARRLGVDRTVDSETEDVEAVVKSLTDGYGAHSVFECSGAAGILESVPPLLRKGGRIVLVAFFHTPPAVDVDKLINNELELVGSRGKRASSFQTALRLVESGHV